MYVCDKGHEFCKCHLELSKIPPIRKLQLLEGVIDTDYLNSLRDDQIDDLDGVFNEEFNNDIPEDLCPICTLSVIPEKLLLKYILNESGQTPKDVATKIRKTMTKIEELEQYVRRTEK